MRQKSLLEITAKHPIFLPINNKINQHNAVTFYLSLPRWKCSWSRWMTKCWLSIHLTLIETCTREKHYKLTNAFSITKRNFHVLIYSFWTCVHIGPETRVALKCIFILCIVWFSTFSSAVPSLTRFFCTFPSLIISFPVSFFVFRFFDFFLPPLRSFYIFIAQLVPLCLHVVTTFHAFPNESEIISTGAFLLNDGWMCQALIFFRFNSNGAHA